MAQEPILPIFASFAAVALTARRHQVTGNGVAALMAWLDVIQCIGWYAAVSAFAVPCLEYLLPELLLSAAFWDKVGAINRVIHAAPE